MSLRNNNLTKGREKGIYGDRKRYKTTTVIMALVILAFIILLVVYGYIHTGSRKNIFTIMAILSVLPFAKMCSILTTLLPYPSITKTQANELKTLSGELEVLYDIVYSTEKTVYPIDCIVIEEGRLLVFSPVRDKKASMLPKALKSLLTEKGYSGYTVKALSDYETFKQMVNSSAASHKATRTTHLIAESILTNCV